MYTSGRRAGPHRLARVADVTSSCIAVPALRILGQRPPGGVETNLPSLPRRLRPASDAGTSGSVIKRRSSSSRVKPHPSHCKSSRNTASGCSGRANARPRKPETPNWKRFLCASRGGRFLERGCCFPYEELDLRDDMNDELDHLWLRVPLKDAHCPLTSVLFLDEISGRTSV